MKRPSAVPWNTRSPAVVRVPPFHGEMCSWRHASFCATGSHASRRPKGLLFGGSTFANIARFQPEAAVRLARPVGVQLPVLVVDQADRHALHRHVDEAGLRIERHRMPVARAIGARDDLARPVAGARDRRLDRTAVLVVAARPVHLDEVLRGDELAVRAIDHEEEAVLGCVQDDLARLAADLQVGEDHRLRRGEVPVVARRLLVVPDVLAGVGIERNDRGEV